jgi:tartrate dehydrogenase/decarboxylase/D-malate dehydrogenase
MLLEHLGHQDAADAVVRAIEKLVEEGKTVTRDLGGKANTKEVGDTLAAMI